MPHVKCTPSEREGVTKRSMSCLSGRVAVIRVSRVLSAQELQGSGYPLLFLLFCPCLPVVSFWCSLSRSYWSGPEALCPLAIIPPSQLTLVLLVREGERMEFGVSGRSEQFKGQVGACEGGARSHPGA